MQWTTLEPDIYSVPIQQFLDDWSFIDILQFMSTADNGPIVHIQRGIKGEVYEHLGSRKVEQGGLLIGRVYAKDRHFNTPLLISVVDSIRCQNFTSTSVSLSMNADVWQQANAATSDGSHVIGWYHSHPNLGAFFSGTDRNTQRNFFSNDYSLGLVVDPVRSQERWFRGSESIEVAPHCIVEVQ